MENEYDDRQRSSREAGVDPGQDLPTDPQWHNPSLQVRQDLCNSGSRSGECKLEQSQGEERRDFYIYFLRRPDKDDPIGTGNGCPFYVGKGSNGRASCHRQKAKYLLYKPGRKSYKVNIIHFLWKRGLDFNVDIFCEDLTEQEAFELEKEAIRIYGKINNKTGCLANLTDGGEGPTGYRFTDEQRKIQGSWNIGKPLPQYIKEKISDSNKKIVKSKE